MTVDEYESIRLIDLEGLTQEEAALQMEVGRSTVQSIYNSARRKLALMDKKAKEPKEFTDDCSSALEKFMTVL